MFCFTERCPQIHYTKAADIHIILKFSSHVPIHLIQLQAPWKTRLLLDKCYGWRKKKEKGFMPYQIRNILHPSHSPRLHPKALKAWNVLWKYTGEVCSCTALLTAAWGAEAQPLGTFIRLNCSPVTPGHTCTTSRLLAWCNAYLAQDMWD